MKTKFNFIIALLSLTIVVFIVFNVQEYNHEREERIHHQLTGELIKVSTEFRLWFGNKKEILNTAKDIVDNYDYETVADQKTLNSLLNINNDRPDVSQIYIGFENGNFVTGGQWVPPDDYDPRTRVWYRDAVVAGTTTISKVYVDRETGDELVTISSPLYLEGEFAGVISADIFMNDINEVLINQVVDKSVYAYLLDAEGTIIAHTKNSEFVGANVFNGIEHAELNRYYSTVQESDQFVNMKYDFDGKTIQGIIQKIEGGDWYISVATPEGQNLIGRQNTSFGNDLFDVTIILVITGLIYLVIRIKYELDQQNQTLTDDNQRDYLTGIFNRRFFNTYMDRIWSSSKETKYVSLMMMDIDHFKKYNDTYGHVMGDEVLKKVTGLIGHIIRKEDVFARYGGEEFALVLNNVTGEDAMVIAEKIRSTVFDANIENKTSTSGHVTISIGVASIVPRDDIKVHEFVDMADRAMYQAKEQGRNRVNMYSI